MNSTNNSVPTGMKLRSGKYVSSNPSYKKKTLPPEINSLRIILLKKTYKNKTSPPPKFKDIAICAIIINIIITICSIIIGLSIVYGIPYCKTMFEYIENFDGFQTIIKNTQTELMKNTSSFGVNIETLNTTSF